MAANDATWRNVWAPPAVLLPPIATIVAVGFAFLGVWLTIKSNNDAEQRRERSSFRLASTQARSAFALAAAQIVMNQPTCKLAQARAITLSQLFPQVASTLEPLTKTPKPALCKQLRTTPTTGGIVFPSFDKGVFFPAGAVFDVPTEAERRAKCLARFGRIYKAQEIFVTVQDPRTHKQTSIINPCFGVKPKPKPSS